MGFLFLYSSYSYILLIFLYSSYSYSLFLFFSGIKGILEKEEMEENTDSFMDSGGSGKNNMNDLKNITIENGEIDLNELTRNIYANKPKVRRMNIVFLKQLIFKFTNIVRLL